MSVNWPEIQDKWQKKWKEAELGKATVQKNKDKFMMIFAYPGISGYLHVGHMRGFSYTDAICRYERLQGKEVLFPVGTHASGNQAIAFANKVKQKDASWIEYLKNNGCSEKKIQELTDASDVIKFFNDVYVQEYWKKFGFLCDWDRFTCTIYPDYEKFIQWQFKKLQQKDLLIQKPYFSTFCPKDGPVAVDPSETDISKGGNAEKKDFIWVKFRMNDSDLILMAGTTRPDALYGQTHLWVDPNGKYVQVQVGDEKWIVGEKVVEKIQNQYKDFKIIRKTNPKELIGKWVKGPLVDYDIYVVPAGFIDSGIGSGIVYSALEDPVDLFELKMIHSNMNILDEYGLDKEVVSRLKPISIISVPGMGDNLGEEIGKEFDIKSSDETDKVELAKSELNKRVFREGIMKENCGVCSGMDVPRCQEYLKERLVKGNDAVMFYDLSEEVVCRCGSPVVIKKIDDQWFIKYSDPELTERSKEQAKEMKIFPQEYHDNMPSVLDWFQDRACARLGNWLGSKFPFDKKWTIEPISDSTLYPAYYIVSKYVNNGSLTPEELTEEFFDYVYLGKEDGLTEKNGGEKNGNENISKKEKWKPIKDEFDYFYPLNMNLGGKEHKTVHFPVFLMNHVAILPEEKWPRGIFVNWWVIGKGSKISKSKGGAEPIPKAIEKFGVDAMRLYYAHIGSPHVDVVWEEDVAMNYKNALERVYTLATELTLLSKNSDGREKTETHLNHWLISRFNHYLKEINTSMERYDLRELAAKVYFIMYDDFRWYVRRGGHHFKTISEALEIWCTLMNPITPHLSEEIYELHLNGKEEKEENESKVELVSSSSWPEVHSNKIDLKSEAGEELVKNTLEGMRNVVKLAKIEKPQKFTLFIAESWLYELFSFLAKEINVTRDIGEVMKKVLEIESLKVKGKDIAKIVQAVIKDASKLPSLVTSQEEELVVMRDAKQFLEKEFGCIVEIICGEDSSEQKAKSAWPGKVGILVE
ncbi:leucine--tRNA ligase [Candidatus Woesearchaeota archaeon]|nr:leucine--tRNA ligase [Candidatus Woesearchaeota archaeon]